MGQEVSSPGSLLVCEEHPQHHHQEKVGPVPCLLPGNWRFSLTGGFDQIMIEFTPAISVSHHTNSGKNNHLPTCYMFSCSPLHALS